MKMAAENSLEDYWEDASVSWGCSLSSCSSLPQQAPREGPAKPSYMQDFHITATSASRPRNFPPPIALCTTLSIKAGGRFVVKEMPVLSSHSLRAEREHGRLCLHLIEPKDSDEDEEDDFDNYDNVCKAEDTSVCAHHHQHEQQDGYKALSTEDSNENIVSNEQEKYDTIHGMSQKLGEAFFEEAEDVAEKCAHTGVSSTSEKHDIETRDDNIAACMPSIGCANDVEIKNEGGTYMGLLGISQHQSKCFWSKEGSNEIAASLSPCSSRQVFSHQSFARTSPSLSLAVS